MICLTANWFLVLLVAWSLFVAVISTTVAGRSR